MSKHPNTRRLFTTKVEEAPVPAAPRVSEKTKAEMAAGLAKLNAYKPVVEESKD